MVDTSVLFVCISNAEKLVVAAGLMRQAAATRVHDKATETLPSKCAPPRPRCS